MSRWEFMRRLEELLSDISPNEREEALQYYNEYFNDAGREHEASVIEALGSPEQVANIVKEGLSDPEEQGEFTETGFCDAAAEERRNQVAKRTIPVAEDSGGIHQAQEKPEAQFEKKRGKDKKGLPIGLQLISDCFQEKKMIQAGYAFEQTRRYEGPEIARERGKINEQTV